MSEDSVANVRVECGLLAAEGCVVKGVWNPALFLADLGRGTGGRLNGSGGLSVLRSMP